MAFFSRYVSEPHLIHVADDTYVIIRPKAQTDDEAEDDDGSEMADRRSLDMDKWSVSGESADLTLGSPSGDSADVTLRSPCPMEISATSDSDASPASIHRPLKKKKRQAPQPPDMLDRHSYSFENTPLRFRTSTESEGMVSQGRKKSILYQTSTDSEPNLMESARGSNFPGELAGIENLHHYPSDKRFLQIRESATPPHSPREQRSSRLDRIREKFRSPQIKRRMSRKKKNTEELSAVHTGRNLLEVEGQSPKSRKSKLEDGSKSPKAKKKGTFEPLPEMSDWIIAVGYTGLEADNEFEVKRIPDYDKYLSGLLEETDKNHVDYEDLSKAQKKVHSMVKEREDELSHADNQTAMDAVQDRFPHDDLQLRLSADNISASSNDTVNNNNSDSPSTNRNSNISSLSLESNHEEKFQKPKGLSLRRRSAPSAVLFKTLAGSRSKNTNTLRANAGMGKKEHDVIHQFKVADTDSNRMFIMEGPVNMATGMQTQERYLFLFSDLLLVAKQKSNTAFKLKHRVQLCDMWIASCIDEVAETTRPVERSFVIGWPTTNVVATFPKSEVKDDWLLKLSERITEEKLKDEGKTLQLKVSPRDLGSNSCPACQMTINNVTQAKDVLLTCLRQMNISENDANDYQLWVLSGKEGSPYPLIGHETPFSIKLSQVRELTRSRSKDDLDTMTSGDLDTVVEESNKDGQKCEFYLKQKKTHKKHQTDETYQKSMKKHRRQNIFSTIIRRIRSPQPLVFGLPLPEIFDENCEPPEPIMRLMVHVYQKGPNINGILRRGNNAALGKDIKEKIDSGVKYSLEEHQAPTAASVFKEFLRDIPDGLLPTELHEQWTSIKKDDPDDEKIDKIKTILQRLPPQNYHLVKLTICLLQHLAKHSDINKMGPSNLATCIAPSFCALNNGAAHHGKSVNLKQVQNSMTEITNVFMPLIAFMITKHKEIFGEDILSMFVKYGCEASPSVSIDGTKSDTPMHPSAEDEEDEEEMMVEEEEEYEYEDAYSRQHALKPHRLPVHQGQQRQRDSNSGTDSDSMHSVLSMPDTGMGFRQDNSSIDSLVDRENEYYPNETESSPKATKSHLSPSNLSRDSGLTLSDTQLYDEDACPVDGKNHLYQRSASHFVDRHDPEAHECEMCSHSMDTRYDRRHNPVPPPRKRGVKKGKEYSDGSDSEQHGFMAVRPPFKHSASTTLLDVHGKRGCSAELKPSLTHPPLNKRVSSDSIGEEDEGTEDEHPVDFQSMRRMRDSNMGMIVKSPSGTHLFSYDAEQDNYNSGGLSGKRMQQRFVRQSSVTESTPPVSPQSRFSQSPRDSMYSDSTFSASRDGSIQSAPQTPDEPQEKALTWLTDNNDMRIANRNWGGNRRLGHSLNINTTLALSKSTSDLCDRDYDEEEDDVDGHGHHVPLAPSYEKYVQKYKPSSPKLWSGKSHEAEEVDMSHRPYFTLSNSEEYSNNSSSSTSRQLLSPPYKRREDLVKGSPPPNVILQSLQQPIRRDSAPLRASYDSAIVAQVRRSSADSFDLRTFDSRSQEASKDMSAIRPEEYLTVTPKPIMITSPEDSFAALSSSSAATRAKLSKYVSSSVDLPLSSKEKDIVTSESKRPDRPPNYQQALQRTFMLKKGILVDIPSDDTEKQKEASAKAKALYEESLQLYNEQRLSPHRSYDSQTDTQTYPQSNSELDYVNKSKSDISVIGETGNSANGNRQYRDAALAGHASQDNLQPVLDQDSPDDSGASGFLDMGTISHSLQQDVLRKRNARAGSDVSTAMANVSAAGSVTVCRNDSKLSDTGSSGSSVTVSTLSKHSDSFGRRSDLSNASNVTVSSVTSSSSSSDPGSLISKRRSGSDFDLHSMAYSRHFRPVEPDHSVSPQKELETVEREEEVEDTYVTLKKDPQRLYLESMQLYEQKTPSEASSISPSFPSSSSPLNKPSASLLSPQFLKSSQYPSSSPHRTPSPASPSSSPSKTAAVSSVPPSTQNTSIRSAFRGKPMGSIPKSTLDVPMSNLHRSRSDSAEHVNKLGSYSPRSASPRDKESVIDRPRLADTRAQSFDTGQEPKPKSYTSDIKAEHHKNFLKAKACFYQPEDSSRNSPVASPRQPAQSTQSSSSSVSTPSSSFREQRLGKWPPPQPSASVPAVHEAKSVDSPLSPRSNSKVPSTPSKPNNTPSNNSAASSSVSETKKEFHWSVKDLKSKYDTDNSGKGNNGKPASNIETTSQTVTQSRPRSPPPYQNPPPFRRLQDNLRQSTSSTSSGGSEQGPSSVNRSSPKSLPSYSRYGPQAYGYDSHGSYSSSEDGYNSSLDRKSIRSRDSSQDGEAISDHTNITYV